MSNVIQCPSALHFFGYDNIDQPHRIGIIYRCCTIHIHYLYFFSAMKQKIWLINTALQIKALKMLGGGWWAFSFSHILLFEVVLLKRPSSPCNLPPIQHASSYGPSVSIMPRSPCTATTRISHFHHQTSFSITPLPLEIL